MESEQVWADVCAYLRTIENRYLCIHPFMRPWNLQLARGPSFDRGLNGPMIKSVARGVNTDLQAS